jgi:tetratricopeptide (TPR) repeat protein
MRNFIRATFAASAFVFLMQAQAAHAVVVVMGNGLAQSCYEAALAISKGLPPPTMMLTGSIIEVAPIKLCTLALDADAIGGRDLAGTYVNRGVIQFMTLEYEGALSDFDRALKVDDTIGEAHANRGAALVALHRWAESIKAIDKGLELGTEEMAKSYYNRAIAYEETGNIRNAYYDYMKAVELVPTWEAPKAQLLRFSLRKRT